MALHELSKARGVSVTADSTDIRGWTALNDDGQAVGRVDELLYDPDESLVRFAVVGTGDRRLLWPVARLGFHDRERAVVLRGLSPAALESLRPYEGVEALDPDMALFTVDAPDAGRAAPGELALGEAPRRIRLLEERLKVDKRQVARQRLTLQKRQVSEETTQEVPLTEEAFTITRRLVDRPAADDEAPRVEGDVTIVPVIAERLVVEKRAFVVEEIVVTKRHETRTETIRDTLMHEEVDISEQALGDEPTD